MKFICNTNELSAACQAVAKAVSQKSSLPAIEGIFINAENNMLTITGYDLELGITTKIEANVEEEGAVIIEARKLCEIVRSMPLETISITCDERQMCYIKSGNTEFSIIGINAEEYPELPIVENGTELNLDTETFKKMIKQTVFACAVVDSKPVHMGVKFEISRNTMCMIAVDGFRLAIRKEKIKYTGEELNFVVPSKTLNEILKLTADENDSGIELYLGKRHIVFKIGNYSIISRLLEGEFLNYKSAIPNGCTTQTVIDTDVLLKSIERTAVVIVDRLKSPVRCIFGDDEIKISCITSNIRVFDKIPASVLGNRIEIGFNSKYFMDALKNADCDEVKIELSGPLSPIKITPVKSEEFLFLVLPVRLKSE